MSESPDFKDTTARIGRVGKETSLKGRHHRTEDGETFVWSIPDGADEADVKEFMVDLILKMLDGDRTHQQQDH